MRGLVLGLLLAHGACTDRPLNVVSDPSNRNDQGGQAAPGLPDATVGVDATNSEAGTARCGKRPCTCDDGLDNDRDGLFDGLDPECTGAYDDDEATFATGLPNKLSACRDCFWDDNSGSGDDGCRYPSECLSDLTFVGKANCSSCEVTQTCADNCQARTPNGCDCFGCCEVAAPDGRIVHVQLAESCDLTRLDDAQSCPTCQLNPSCQNRCGRCELCLGKTNADLPTDCASGSHECEGGLSVCDNAQPCPPGYYCLQGCCLVDLL
jgi:hypothetical protein